MREPPTLRYSGLTIVLDYPSRFDKDSLISGFAGKEFDASLKIPRQMCDIVTLSSLGEFLPNTKVVLLLGQDALKKFNQNVSLMTFRGSPFVIDGKIFIASFRPQDAVDRQNYFGNVEEEEKEEDDKKFVPTRRSNWMFWLKRDIDKAVYLLNNPIKEYKTTTKLFPTLDEVVKILESTKGKEMYLDIETDMITGQLLCVGFAFDETVYVVPFLDHQYKYFYDKPERFLVALLKAMHNNTVVVHNAMFDLLYLAWRYRLAPPRDVYDTMVSHHRLFPEVEKSLGHCISLYTHAPYHKNEIISPKTFDQYIRLCNYNAKDVASLKPVKDGIEEYAKKLGAQDSIRQANRSITPYIIASLRGIKLDESAISSVVMGNEKKKAQILRILRIITNRNINPNSPKQVGEYLYKVLKLPKGTTDEKTMLQLLLKHERPEIYYFLEFRKLSKENSSLGFTRYTGLYGDRLPNRATTAYNIAGTKTFRLASRAMFDKLGGNLQNISKPLRRLFVPDEGKVFIQCDQAGAEALVVAYLCRPGPFRQLFLNGIKSHVYVAMHLFRDIWEAELGHSIEEFIFADITKIKSIKGWKELEDVIKKSDDRKPEERYYFIAKQVCHSSNYGIKADGLRMNILVNSQGKVFLSNEQANIFLSLYHRLFPEIRQWHADVISTVRQTKMLRNLFGYPRYFSSYSDEYKEMFAFIPQSTVATITNLAFTELYDRSIDKNDKLYGIELMQNNHDSLLIQCPESMVDIVAKEVAKHMNKDLISPRGEKFQMRSEVGVGYNWKELKPYA